MAKARSTAKKAAKKSTAKVAKSPAKKKATAKTKVGAKKKAASSAVAIVRALRAHALSFPDTVEEFPWDHSVVKVGKKVIVFLEQDHLVKDTVHFSVKLPESSSMALSLPGATPTGYGLGKAGWVSFAFTPSDAPPLGVMTAWIDESFVAIAPKRAITRWREARR